MRPNSQKTADLVKFTGEIYNGKLLVCAVTIINVKNRTVYIKENKTFERVWSRAKHIQWEKNKIIIRTLFNN